MWRKKGKKIFGRVNKKYYLCHRYPENNLFTLKETNTKKNAFTVK